MPEFDPNPFSMNQEFVPNAMFKRGSIIAGRSNGEPEAVLADDASVGDVPTLQADGSIAFATPAGGGGGGISTTDYITIETGDFNVLNGGSPTIAMNPASLANTQDWFSLDGSNNIVLAAGAYMFSWNLSLGGTDLSAATGAAQVIFNGGSANALGGGSGFALVHLSDTAHFGNTLNGQCYITVGEADSNDGVLPFQPSQFSGGTLSGCHLYLAIFKLG